MNTIFDTHCHPYLNKQKEQNTVITNFFQNGWKYMTVIWTNLKTSKISIEIANKYDWVFVTIWIHPCDITGLDLDNTIKTLENLYKDNKEKIVWIWECWLDYYRLERDNKINKLEKVNRDKIIEKQKKIQWLFFKAQILLAKKYDLPVIIHNRESKDDVLKILKELDFKKFIFHCYSENLEYAQKLIEFSPECKISFSGIITFNSAQDIQKTAKNIDINHILAETDSPYLTPTPYRWKEENEPLYTKYIIEKINKLRWEICDEQILNNSLEIFWLKNKD